MKQNMILYIFFALFGFLSRPLSAQNKPIKICTDSNYWYPFTFVKEGKAAGIHIDISKKALSNLGFQPSFRPLPWKRCLAEAKNGKYDAIVSASYKKERAKFLDYPKDAEKGGKSPLRLQQVEYVVATLSGSSFEFQGDLSKLPEPVRSVLGYSIVDHLKEKGVKVQTNNGVKKNFLRLVRSQRGSVVTTLETAKGLSQKPQFRGKIKIHKKPIKSKSYFLAFSKKSNNIVQKEKDEIWYAIKKINEDNKTILEFSERY